MNGDCSRVAFSEALKYVDGYEAYPVHMIEFQSHVGKPASHPGGCGTPRVCAIS